MSYSRIIDGIVFAFCLYFFTTPAAFAYVDPGTGSYLVQLVIGGLLTVGFSLRTVWRDATNGSRQNDLSPTQPETDEVGDSVTQDRLRTIS